MTVSIFSSLLSVPRWAAVVLAIVIGGLSPVGVARGQAPAPAAAPGVVESGPIRLRAVPQFPRVTQGGELVVAVEIDHGPEFHTWPAAHEKLPKAVDEFAIRTRVGPVVNADGKAVLPAWVERFVGTQYPATKIGKAPDPDGGAMPIEVPLYSGKSVFYARFLLTKDASLGEQTLDVQASFQACNDTICLQNEDLVLPVRITVVAAPAADLGPAADAALFANFDAAKPSFGGTGPATATAAIPSQPTPPTTPNATTPAASGAPTPAVVGAGSDRRFFGLAIGNSLPVLFLFAAIGGLVLNLTPCVLPVIPIKIMTLTQHAKSPAKALVLGLWMALGVIIFWTAIGVPMAFVSTALDPSKWIFGIWWITLALGVVIALMGLGIMGLFQINLPQSVYMINPKADSPWGSFVYGVFTAVLGLPCFGFVAGGLLASATALPALDVMTIFFGLGVGMALPYLILSARPSLLKFIPRTGPASELVKQVMGLLLLGAAAFFVAAGIKALTSSMPYIKESIEWWGVAFFIVVASLWLLFRTFQIARSVVWRGLMTALALAMSGSFVWFAADKTGADRNNYLELKAAQASAAGTGQLVTGVWTEYDPVQFQRARAEHKSVFLDFTATWCIVCKANKRLVLDPDPVRGRLKSSDIVLMKVDLTAKDAPGWAKLNELGRTGIPTWAIFGPDASTPIIIDTPTPQNVLSALDQLGVRPRGESKATASR